MNDRGIRVYKGFIVILFVNIFEITYNIKVFLGFFKILIWSGKFINISDFSIITLSIFTWCLCFLLLLLLFVCSFFIYLFFHSILWASYFQCGIEIRLSNRLLDYIHCYFSTIQFSTSTAYPDHVLLKMSKGLTFWSYP